MVASGRSECVDCVEFGRFVSRVNWIVFSKIWSILVLHDDICIRRDDDDDNVCKYSLHTQNRPHLY